MTGVPSMSRMRSKPHRSARPSVCGDSKLRLNTGPRHLPNRLLARHLHRHTWRDLLLPGEFRHRLARAGLAHDARAGVEIARTRLALGDRDLARRRDEHPRRRWWCLPASRDAAKPGRLRLLYEAKRFGFIIGRAGRRASTGRRPVPDVAPTRLHQRIGFVFGSRHEVERHHLEPIGLANENPLFVERSLSRD